MDLEVGNVEAFQVQAFLGEKLDPNIAYLEAPFEGEILEPWATHRDLRQPHVADPQAIVQIKLLQPRRRRQRRRLQIAEPGAVGDVHALQIGAAPRQRLQPLESQPRAPAQRQPLDPPRPGRSSGDEEGDGGGVDAGADREVEGGDAGEFGEEGQEELGAEDPEVSPVERVDPVEGLACQTE